MILSIAPPRFHPLKSILSFSKRLYLKNGSIGKQPIKGDPADRPYFRKAPSTATDGTGGD